MKTFENSIVCPMCGDLHKKNELYVGKSELYAFQKKIVYCKSCLEKIYENYLQKTNDKEKAIYYFCRKIDVPFRYGALDGALKETRFPLFAAYLQKINSLGGKNEYGNNFDESDTLVKAEEATKKEDKVKDVNDDNKKLLENDVNEDITEKVEFSEEDEKVKQDVIRLISYDPFCGYELFDQKFLYNELLPYLDEDTLADTYKLSQIIQLVNNNNQIRRIDLMVNKMSSNPKDFLANQGDIKTATAIKNQIVSASDKIAKENAISVKNRGDKSAGKSTLTYMMKDYRELGFEDAEQDYYDQNKAKGMKMTADISNKSILEQLQLDENDINDMLLQQRELIQQLQTTVDDLEEENRQLYTQIEK